MQPVLLVKMPNEPRFIGTYDITNYRKWWTSEPLPGGVADIVDFTWIYGTYYIAIVRKTTNAYSIYQSRDYGKTWREVFAAPSVLYRIVAIMPGWAICSASDGWFESRDSGTTWRRISRSAPGCREVILLQFNTLFAHDSKNIWKSTDYGRTWTISLNYDKTKTSSRYYFGNYRYTSLVEVHPALAGNGTEVIASLGNRLFVTDTLGDKWYDPYLTGHPGYKPYFWFGNGSVMQIVPSGVVFSGNKFRTMYVFRVHYRKDGIIRYYQLNSLAAIPKAKFDLPFTGYENGRLSTQIIQMVGSTEIRSTVYCSSMYYNTSTGTYVPLVRYSTDGGVTWKNLDLRNVNVRNSIGEPVPNVFLSSFLIDKSAFSSWCGNYFQTKTTYGSVSHRIVMMSYDIDAIIGKPRIEDRPIWMDALMKKTFNARFQNMSAYLRKTISSRYNIKTTSKRVQTRNISEGAYVQKTFTMPYDSDVLCLTTLDRAYDRNDVMILKTEDFPYDNDVLMQKTITSTYDIPAYIQKEFQYDYDIDQLLQKEFESVFNADVLNLATEDISYSFDVAQAGVYEKEVPIDVLCRTDRIAVLYNDSYVEKPVERTYGMNVVIVDRNVDDAVIRIERVLPQVFELWTKMMKYDVYDSRKDTEYNQ